MMTELMFKNFINSKILNIGTLILCLNLTQMIKSNRDYKFFFCFLFQINESIIQYLHFLFSDSRKIFVYLF